MADLCSSSALPLLFPFCGALHMPSVYLLRCALSPALQLSTTVAFSHPSLPVSGRQAAHSLVGGAAALPGRPHSS